MYFIEIICVCEMKWKYDKLQNASTIEAFLELNQNQIGKGKVELNNELIF